MFLAGPWKWFSEGGSPVIPPQPPLPPGVFREVRYVREFGYDPLSLPSPTNVETTHNQFLWTR